METYEITNLVLTLLFCAALSLALVDTEDVIEQEEKKRGKR